MKQKIIYGLSNYKMVQDGNYLYIDKTRYIEQLEALGENYLIFLRPRRFGKSLFLSTLQYYYDERNKEEFEALFSDTYIGQNPTPLRNSYRILFFEFSGINVDEGMNEIYEGFRANVKMSLHIYLSNYGYDEYTDKLNDIKSSSGLLKYFFEVTKNDSIYLLIDEYDHFANAILAYSMGDFLKVVGKGGFVRAFYEVLKSATQTGVLQKMYITGVTPITLDSLSSGFNIVKHITYKKEFNAMAGFTQQEALYSLEHSIFAECPSVDRDEILQIIKTWYNGYLFNGKAIQRIYNATLLNWFITEYDFDDCQMPQKMLDSNVASDYKAIMRLFHIGDSNQNYQILQELIEKNAITGTIKDRYDLSKTFTRDDFITLIYSMGFITIKEPLFADKYIFEIPNYVIKILYFNYFAVELEQRNAIKTTADISTLLLDLAMGEEQSFAKQLDTVITILSNRDYTKFDEKYFQMIALSMLSFSSDFYFIDSQIELDNRYPDILLIGRDERVPNNYLFELKWLRGGDSYESIKRKGIEQVEGYKRLDKVQGIPKLRSFLLIGSKDGVEWIGV